MQALSVGSDENRILCSYLSVCPNETSWLPPGRCSWKLVFGIFTKICWSFQWFLKSHKSNSPFTWICMYINDCTYISPSICVTVNMFASVTTLVYSCYTQRECARTVSLCGYSSFLQDLWLNLTFLTGTSNYDVMCRKHSSSEIPNVISFFLNITWVGHDVISLPYGSMNWICLLPSIHVCSYNLFWALASFKERLPSSLSPPRFLHPRIPRISNTFLWKTSFRLTLGFPTDLVLCNFPLRISSLRLFLLSFLRCDPLSWLQEKQFCVYVHIFH